MHIDLLNTMSGNMGHGCNVNRYVWGSMLKTHGIRVKYVCLWQFSFCVYWL